MSTIVMQDGSEIKFQPRNMTIEIWQGGANVGTLGLREEQLWNVRNSEQFETWWDGLINTTATTAKALVEFNEFLAQPRYVDPYKGVPASELSGPYTNAKLDPEGVTNNTTNELEYITIPRAIMLMEAGSSQLKLLGDADFSVSTSTLPTLVILPLRVKACSDNVTSLTFFW